LRPAGKKIMNNQKTALRSLVLFSALVAGFSVSMPTDPVEFSHKDNSGTFNLQVLEVEKTDYPDADFVVTEIEDVRLIVTEAVIDMEMKYFSVNGKYYVCIFRESVYL